MNDICHFSKWFLATRAPVLLLLAHFEKYLVLGNKRDKYVFFSSAEHTLTLMHIHVYSFILNYSMRSTTLQEENFHF